MRSLLLAILSALVLACPADENKTQARFKSGLPAEIDVDRPEDCQLCHAAIYEEWMQSMHSHAHHDQDPVFAAVRKLRKSKEGRKIERVCAGCHAPRDLEDLESPRARTGVNCSACHNVAVIDQSAAPGGARLMWADSRLLLGPHDLEKGRSPAHETGPAPSHMKDGASLCLVCHNELRSKTDLPICTTGVEWSAERVSSGTTPSCVDCHMPLLKGPSGTASSRAQHRGHRFLGVGREWSKGEVSGPVLSGRFQKEDLLIELQNKAAHAFPTGFPGRRAEVRLTGYDRAGKEVWRGPQTMLGKQYLDAQGKPSLAPYAARLGVDSRVHALDSKRWTFQVPKSVVRVQVQLLYWLVTPPLAARLELSNAPEAQSRVISQTEVRR